MIEYKTISFRVDEETYNALQEHARVQYLSLSAYIRKTLNKQLELEDTANELQRTITEG